MICIDQMASLCIR